MLYCYPDGTNCEMNNPDEFFTNIVYIESNFEGFTTNSNDKLVLDNSFQFAQTDTQIYDLFNHLAGTITISPKSVISQVLHITLGQGNINDSFLVHEGSVNNTEGTRLIANFFTENNIVFNLCNFV